MRSVALIASTALALLASLAQAGAPAASAPGAAMARAAPPPSALGIPPFAMHYQVLRNGWQIGEASFTLDHKGDVWHFYSQAQPVGVAAIFLHSTWSESSRFTLHDQRLRPLMYSYTDTGNPDHDETITFDWKIGKAQDVRGGHEKSLAITSGMLDRLSAQLEISRQLAAGEPLSDPYLVVKGGEINHYHLAAGKRENVTTPAGRFDTLVVTRKDPDSDSTTVFWMAPKYRWLPVKIEQRETGEATYGFVLDGLQWLN